MTMTPQHADQSAAAIDLRDPAEQGRGRTAEAPHEIPPRGWRDVARRVKDESREDNLTLVAAGIAFFSLLSIAPAMIAAISLYGLVASPADVAKHLDDLTGTMPEEARRLISDQLNEVVNANSAGLSVGLVVGVILALWGASTAMNHLLVALSTAYDEHETRGYLKLRGRALVLTIVGIAVIGISLVLLTVAPAWVNDRGNATASTVVSLLRWPLLLVLMLGALAVLYRYAPDRDEPKWRWVSWGAVIATGSWIVASIGFSLYAGYFGSYNKTYGSMAAVIVLMVWLFITALCILVGAEVNAELEHQTVQDTTRGPELPPGRRDAYVADTVGPRSS